MNIVNDFDTNSYIRKIKSSEKLSVDAHEDRVRNISIVFLLNSVIVLDGI